MKNKFLAAGLWAAFLFCLACPLAVAASDAVAREALRQLALPLNGAEELHPLIERAGEARLVLLGEASHGTSEFYVWRKRISQRLIEERGFDFIAIEGDWAFSRAVDRYVRDLPGAADSGRQILEQGRRWPEWMWGNQETLELIEWLRSFNQQRPLEKRVGFHGIDVYGADEALAALFQTLQERDPALQKDIADLYGSFGNYLASPRNYLQALAAGMEPFAGRVAQAAALISERTQDWPEGVRLDVLQCAEVVRQSEAHYRLMSQRGSASWNARVDHFYATVERLTEHYGETSRGIVWAHNTHIGDARATSMVRAGKTNIGQISRQKLGRSEVFAVGFGTWRGTVVAGEHWGSERQVMTLPQGSPGSVEAMMGGLGLPTALFIFPKENPPAVLNMERGHRAVGVVYHPQREAGNYVPTRLLDRYDAFIFIRETKALDVIDPR